MRKQDLEKAIGQVVVFTLHGSASGRYKTLTFGRLIAVNRVTKPNRYSWKPDTTSTICVISPMNEIRAHGKVNGYGRFGGNDNAEVRSAAVSHVLNEQTIEEIHQAMDGAAARQAFHDSEGDIMQMLADTAAGDQRINVSYYGKDRKLSITVYGVEPTSALLRKLGFDTTKADAAWQKLGH